LVAVVATDVRLESKRMVEDAMIDETTGKTTTAQAVSTGGSRRRGEESGGRGGNGREA
jgi:hypothetical protein